MVKLNTSIIIPSKFLLSPFPPSNVGVGTATVWPIAGVPSSFLQVGEQNSNLDVSSWNQQSHWSVNFILGKYLENIL